MKKDSSLTEYYKYISAIGKHVMREKRADGETMHLALLGYRNIKKDGRSTIEPDPKTFHLVQEARRLRKDGYTLREICLKMKELGLRSQRGNIIGTSSMDKLLKRLKSSNYDGS